MSTRSPYLRCFCRGDGDCLFYAMADVANEVRRDMGDKLRIDGLSPRRADNPISVDTLRSMVSQSLTDSELSFFRAANDLN
jgi:hypothetical protein